MALAEVRAGKRLEKSLKSVEFKAMSKWASSYRKLLEKCQVSKDRYKESWLCVFALGIGKFYNGKLVVVGRATNGWGNAFSKDVPGDCQRLLSEFLPTIGKDNLDWVIDQWGIVDTKTYNPNKSAFWRVSRMLANRIASESDDCINHIAWTNLYKVAPDGGNPSSRLMEVQFEKCVEILKLEIEETKAEKVVFLTGYGWAQHFLKRLNVFNQLSLTNFKYVEFASSADGVNYVVGQHPQGKSEQPHYEEIIQAFAFLSVKP